MISLAHMLLILVHIPIIFFPLASVLLLVNMRWHTADIQRIILTLLVVSSITTICYYLTGEEAEELVEHLTGIRESTIDTHEDNALYALWFSCITGGLAALIACGEYARISARALTIAMKLLPLLVVATSICLVWVGYQGGMIRHTELQQSIDTRGGNESQEDD
jgi:hypothetical protein